MNTQVGYLSVELYSKPVTFRKYCYIILQLNNINIKKQSDIQYFSTFP